MRTRDDGRDGRLAGVVLWDGDVERGACDIHWDDDGTGTDAVLTVVDPSPERSRGQQARYAVVPGLVDTHVHLAGYAGPVGRRPDFLTWPLVTRPEERTLHALAQAQRALAAGVTTLRDLSADDVQFSLRRAIDEGVVTGPRLMASGMVGMTGGHGDMFTPAAVAVRPPTADGVSECRKLVRSFARAGADGIKIATSGGVLSVGDASTWRGHTQAEVAAIVDEAHALGLRVAAHAHTAAGIAVALAEGVDSLEHATAITPEQADAAAAAGVSIAPTLLINDRIAAGGSGAAPAQVAKARELLAGRDALLAGAAARGVNVVLGTDANGAHVAFGEQWAELARMVHVLDWSPERVMVAATSRAAEALGRGHELGRLAPGHRADFLVLTRRPWRDPGALADPGVVAVVSRGRVVAGSLPPGPTPSE